MATPIRFFTGMAFLIFSICAFAQANPDPDEDEDTKVLAPITVTGYHIKRMDLEGPAPVMVFQREDLEQAGIVTLEEFATYLTINKPNSVQGAPAGMASFNLRGIGIDTTLVLVNGFRIASSASAAENVVDVNSIPVSAIDRIEILKDGASAIYGADAIAGVVNIILRTGFNGIEVNAGYGNSQHGGGREILADLVAGRDTGRGSIMFTLSWYDREPQALRERDWSNDPDYSSVGGPNSRSTMSSPPTFFRYDTISWEADPACGADPLSSSVGPSHWGPEWGTACRFNWARYQDLYRGFKRVGAGLSGRYEIKANLSLFGDILYNRVEGEDNWAPAVIGASSLIETWTGAPYVPANHPGNPFGTDGELRSRLLDTGNRREANKATAYRAVLGLEGLWGDWDWRLSGLASQSKVNNHYQNQVLIDRYQLALLGSGGPDGDQWYDPFGANPQNDPALLDWLTTDASSSDSNGEYSIDLLFSRMFGALPGGPAGFAIGLQYREQDLDQWADENLLNGALHVTREPVSADRDIASAYFEFKLPLLDSLEAQLALRYEHYSDFGSTTNPKIALRWQPLPSLMFRGSWSTSFKPPSFYELYIPMQHYVGGYRDTVRCEITGLPEDCTRREYPAEGGGNPHLDPETGESWFAGMVWTPGFLPGFEFQFDFWKFRHKERIEWLSGQTVLNEGGDLGIIREPPEADGTPGRIILVQETYVNIDELLTRGFDTTLRYSWQTDRAGDFRASLMYTYIDQWKIAESASGYFFLNKNVAGHWWGVAVPRNRANVNVSWDMGQHAAAANIHYTGHWYNAVDLWVDGEPTDQPMVIPSHTTLDLQYSYTFERLRNATVRFGCNNVTDKDPPLVYWPSNEPFHDGRGRFFYIRWQQPIL